MSLLACLCLSALCTQEPRAPRAARPAPIPAWIEATLGHALGCSSRLEFTLELADQEALILVDGQEELRSSPQRALGWSEQRQVSWSDTPLRFERGHLVAFERGFERLEATDTRSARLRAGESRIVKRLESPYSGRRLAFEREADGGWRADWLPDPGAQESGAPDPGAQETGAPDSGAPDSGAPDSGAQGGAGAHAPLARALALASGGAGEPSARVSLDEPLCLRLAACLAAAVDDERVELPLELVTQLAWPGGELAFAPRPQPAAGLAAQPAAAPTSAATPDDRRVRQCREAPSGEASARRLGTGRLDELIEGELAATFDAADAGARVELWALSLQLDTGWGDREPLQTRNGGVGDASLLFEMELELEGPLVRFVDSPGRLELWLRGPLRIDREEVRSLQAERGDFESTRTHRFEGECRLELRARAQSEAADASEER